MVKLRLRRKGRIHNPVYDIVAVDVRVKRDGGYIETSGFLIDSLFASVDTSAPHGNTGLWLIDPYDYTIGSLQAGAITSALRTNNLTITTENSNASYGSTPFANYNGNITISSAIYSFATTSLSLVAANNININADIVINGSFSAQARNAININADILNNINKRNKESIYEEVYNTEFKCSKCKESKTSTEYVNKHLKMDESSSLKVTCLVCNNKWYI